MSKETLEQIARMTLPQQAELVRLSLEHPGSTWHFNDCGCCVCFHPEGKTHNKTGYIIGADGESEFHDTRTDP